MNAAMPPVFCAFAMIVRASVVFPEDSGPYISTTLPRGTPPIPSAMSSDIAPVEIDGMSSETSSPRRMMAPSPKLSLMSATVASRGVSASAKLTLAFFLCVERQRLCGASRARGVSHLS